MSKVHVFTKGLAPEEVEALVLLLRAAGVPANEIVLVDEVELATDDCEKDVYVLDRKSVV